MDFWGLPMCGSDDQWLQACEHAFKRSRYGPDGLPVNEELQSFRFFGDFPQEIQDTVWEYAVLSSVVVAPTIVNIDQDRLGSVRAAHHSEFQDERDTRPWTPIRWVCRAANEAVKRVCEGSGFRALYVENSTFARTKTLLDSSLPPCELPVSGLGHAHPNTIVVNLAGFTNGPPWQATVPSVVERLTRPGGLLLADKIRHLVLMRDFQYPAPGAAPSEHPVRGRRTGGIHEVFKTKLWLPEWDNMDLKALMTFFKSSDLELSSYPPIKFHVQATSNPLKWRTRPIPKMDRGIWVEAVRIDCASDSERKQGREVGRVSQHEKLPHGPRTSVWRFGTGLATVVEEVKQTQLPNLERVSLAAELITKDMAGKGTPPARGIMQFFKNYPGYSLARIAELMRS